jgi:phosphate transport system permease protein
MTPLAPAGRRLLSPRTTQALALSLLSLLTLATVLLLLVLVGLLLWRGLPTLGRDFLFAQPRDQGRAGGILPMLLASLGVTLIAVTVATPLGLGTAIYLSEYSREGVLARTVRFAAEALATLPSIVFGLFGFVFFVLYLGMGWSLLAGGLTVAAMILPTLVRTAEESMRSVPVGWRELSWVLGASRWQTVTRVVLPAALPGIVTGLLLGVGRSMAEAAALLFSAGTSLAMPTSLLSPARTLSVHVYLMAHEGTSAPMTYGAGAVLVITILAINAVAYALMNRAPRFR